MMKKLLLAAALWPAAALAADEPVSQRVVINAVRDQEWCSYRYAYGAAAYFSKFTATRPLIQAHMQMRPLVPEATLDGLSLQLAGEKTDLVIAVDAMGRSTIPLIKQAYDEDAVLRLNRQRGNYYASGRYSIKERDDGVYAAADLRAACEQLIDAQRSSGYRFRLFGKKCAGVKIVYALNDAAAGAVYDSGAGVATALPGSVAHPFEDESMGLYKVVTYRFADWPEDGVITTSAKPLAIGTLYE